MDIYGHIRGYVLMMIVFFAGNHIALNNFVVDNKNDVNEKIMQSMTVFLLLMDAISTMDPLKWGKLETWIKASANGFTILWRKIYLIGQRDTLCRLYFI